MRGFTVQYIVETMNIEKEMFNKALSRALIVEYINCALLKHAVPAMCRVNRLGSGSLIEC